MIANSKGPESLISLVQELGDGVSAGTVKDAAAADTVVLAVMWPDVSKTVEGLEWAGRIAIDPTNDFDPSDLNGRTSSEAVADLVAPGRVVKAGNTRGRQDAAARRTAGRPQPDPLRVSRPCPAAQATGH
jgi:predicted dinucleotide-binding enzyme